MWGFNVEVLLEFGRTLVVKSSLMQALIFVVFARCYLLPPYSSSNVESRALLTAWKSSSVLFQRLFSYWRS